MSKENSMCWFPFYANDFLGSMDVQLMTLDQVGAYALLLAWQWNSPDCRLPSSPASISKLARLDIDDPQHEIVRRKFEQADGWYNAKLLKVWGEQLAKYEKMSNGGRKGGSKGGLNGGSKQPEPEPYNTPIPPKGAGTDKPKKPKINKRRLSQTDKKRVKVDANSELMKRIGSWFGRSPDTLWNVYESEALVSVDPSESELQVVETYYTAHRVGDKDYRRKNVETLLNNWSGEMDRATAFGSRKPKHGGVAL